MKVHSTPVVWGEREKRAGFLDPSRHSPARRPWPDLYGKIAKEFTAPTVAVDLGCGLGAETTALLACGFDVYGVDATAPGDWTQVPARRYRQVDIRAGLLFEPVPEFIVCREVAEHLGFRWSEVLVRNIIRNSVVTYFTAAPPGQRGSGHINLQFRKFWLALFNKYGWKLDQELTEFNREHNPKAIDRSNGMVLRGPRRPRLALASV